MLRIDVKFYYYKINTNKKGGRKHLEVIDTLWHKLVMASQIYTYLQTCQVYTLIIYGFWYVSHTSVKCFLRAFFPKITLPFSLCFHIRIQKSQISMIELWYSIYPNKLNVWRRPQIWCNILVDMQYRRRACKYKHLR